LPVFPDFFVWDFDLFYKVKSFLFSSVFPIEQALSRLIPTLYVPGCPELFFSLLFSEL
jgi:hypothetical protein